MRASAQFLDLGPIHLRARGDQKRDSLLVTARLDSGGELHQPWSARPWAEGRSRDAGPGKERNPSSVGGSTQTDFRNRCFKR